MAATLIGLSGFTHGIASEETGINIESITISATSKKIEVPDKVGETRGIVYYDEVKEATLTGETTGATDKVIGAALTVANNQTVGGVSSSAFYVDAVDIELSREALKKITIKAKAYKGVS